MLLLLSCLFSDIIPYFLLKNSLLRSSLLRSSRPNQEVYTPTSKTQIGNLTPTHYSDSLYAATSSEQTVPHEFVAAVPRLL